MNRFISIQDVPDVLELVRDALGVKQQPHAWSRLGAQRTLGMLFLSPSLRTRISTHKAALNLGMNVMLFNSPGETRVLEAADGAIMDGAAAEHAIEVARVLATYFDIVALRSVGGAMDSNEERGRKKAIFEQFIRNTTVPLVNMQSADAHPLQALADLMTIRESFSGSRPKVVLTWVPDPGSPPRSVINSILRWFPAANVDLVVTHPQGYELDQNVRKALEFEPKQDRALEGADFVYAKSWSRSTADAGEELAYNDWMLTPNKMALTNNGRLMHPLPVRRNYAVSGQVLDSAASIVLAQAANREFAAQAVLKRLLESI